ncbi:hypothetical protein ACKFKG_23360 [Phormidesmis sp. 146-35]
MGVATSSPPLHKTLAIAPIAQELSKYFEKISVADKGQQSPSMQQMLVEQAGELLHPHQEPSKL